MISTRDNNIKQLPERLTLLELPRPNALANLKRGRRRQANPIDDDNSLPAGYNLQLQAIISAINEEVRRDIIPAIYRAKPEYTADAWPTMMTALLTAFAERWVGSMFDVQAERIAVGTVRRIEAVNGQSFLKSVNQSVGIEVFGSHSESIAIDLEVDVLENAEMIKQVVTDHMKIV